MKRVRTGVAIIEVMVAMTILATAGVALLSMARSHLAGVALAESRDAESRRVNALMVAASLWSPSDLDRHLGQRRQGPWTMIVDRAHPSLYRVAIADSTGAVLLDTWLYRPEGNGAGDAR